MNQSTLFFLLYGVLIFLIFSYTPFCIARKAIKDYPKGGKKLSNGFLLIPLLLTFLPLISLLLYPVERISFGDYESHLFILKENLILFSLSALITAFATWYYLRNQTSKIEMEKFKGRHTSPTFPDDWGSFFLLLSVVLTIVVGSIKYLPWLSEQISTLFK